LLEQCKSLKKVILLLSLWSFLKKYQQVKNLIF
jgi:hypothetical protein